MMKGEKLILIVIFLINMILVLNDITFDNDIMRQSHKSLFEVKTPEKAN